MYGTAIYYSKCDEEKSRSSRSLTESSGATARLRRSREQTAEDGLGAIHGEQVCHDLLAADGSVRYNAGEWHTNKAVCISSF